MNLGLRDRVAIVGGASQGIGRATAELLAAEGCRVVVAARNETALAAAAAAISGAAGGEQAGTNVLAVPCDMSIEADVSRLVARAAQAFGGIDILVNNAGGPPLGAFERHDDAAWRKAFDTNFMSVVWMVREALPHLRRSSQGRIINITSTAVREPIEGLILSNSIRLGTTGLAKTLSRELGPARHHREQRRTRTDRDGPRAPPLRSPGEGGWSHVRRRACRAGPAHPHAAPRRAGGRRCDDRLSRVGAGAPDQRSDDPRRWRRNRSRVARDGWPRRATRFESAVN